MSEYRRNSSEYSQSSTNSIAAIQKHGITLKFSREENRKARGKIYGLLFKDPLALVAILPTMAAGATPILTYLVFGQLIQAMTLYANDKTYDPMPTVNWGMIYMAIITVITTICRFLQSFLWVRVGARISVKIRDEIMTSIMKCDVAFFDQNPIGNLLTVLGEDSAIIQECFGQVKGQQFANAGQFLTGVILTYVYQWKLGLIVTALAPVIVVIMLSFHPAIERNAQARFRNVSTSMTIAEETLAAIRTVRGFNREERDRERFKGETDNGTKYDKKTVYLLNIMFTIVFLLMWTVVDGCTYYGATMVDKGELTVGDMFSAFGFIMFGCFAIIIFENSMQAEQRAIHAGARVMRLITYQSPINFDGGLKYDDFKGHIEFKNVSFRYPTRNVMALINVSFEVKPGEMAALVGHSGSGKSTCVQLLERFYDVTEGIISIDGHDIREIDPRWLHRKMALVSQEPTLFQASVRDNVLYGIEDKSSKTDDDVWKALEAANAKNFVKKMDHQLDQLVGDRGNSISGGQRPRIAIARAVIKDPVIMLTDEATSALDAASEKKVQAALDVILATKTSVVVAHRLSTIRNAHTIYVFHNGHIVEQGDHASLVRLGKVYYQLVKRQLAKDDLEIGEAAAKEAEEKSSDSEEKKENEEKPLPPPPSEETPEEEVDNKAEKIRRSSSSSSLSTSSSMSDVSDGTISGSTATSSSISDL